MLGLKNKKILIFGTGAVGGYYGGMLVKAGYDVTFVARGKNYEALKQNGLTLVLEGKKEILPINVEAIHDEVQQINVDAIHDKVGTVKQSGVLYVVDVIIDD